MAGLGLKTASFMAAGLLTVHGESLFDEAQALHYMQYARAAFCDESAIQEWDCGEMCDEAPTVKGSVLFIAPSQDMYAVQGYVAEVPAGEGHTGTQCVVALRGSVVWQNWIEDLAYALAAWPRNSAGPVNASWCEGCMVHDGFATAFDHIQKINGGRNRETRMLNLGCKRTLAWRSHCNACVDQHSWRARTSC